MDLHPGELGDEMTDFTRLVLTIAEGENGQHEVGGNNLGPAVEKYLASIGLAPGNPWCCAFVCWCIKQAAAQLSVTPEFSYHGSVYSMWENNPSLRIDAPVAGCLALRDEGTNSEGHRVGHVLFVIAVSTDGQTLTCISGNTNAQGSREGNCVAIQERPISQFANGYGFMRIA